MLRQALHPDYYNPNNITHKTTHGFDHKRHCITSLLESLMCSVDVTPIVWTWDEEAQRSFPRSDILHSCRNFEKIHQWAKGHQLDRKLITTVHVEDDLE